MAAKEQYLNFEKLHIVDGVLLAIHVLYWCCISFPVIIIFLILGVRVPRIVLHILGQRTPDEQKWI